MPIRFFYILICSFFTISSWAQDYNYQHYDLTSGLSGLTVYSIVQDQNGFIWFGTETGLSRFDGKNFKNFTTTDGLPDNEVLKLYVDSKNRVWILSFTNSVCYYKDGIIYSAKNDSLLAQLKFLSEPYNIFEDADGNITIIERSIIHVIRKDRKIYDYDKVNNVSLSTISAGINDKGNVAVYVSLQNGRDNWGILEINRTKPGISSFQQLSDNSEHVSYLTFIIRNQLKAFRKYNNIIVQAGNSDLQDTFDIPENFVGFSYLADSLLSLNCNNKVLLYNINKNKITDTFFLGKMVNCSFLDNEGNYWFATTGYGVYRLTSLAFKNYTFFSSENYLPVYSIGKKGDYLFVGTNHSLMWRINMKVNSKPAATKFDVNYGEGRISNLLLHNDDIIVGIDGLHYLHPDNSITTLMHGNAIKKIYKYGDSLLISTHIRVYKLNINDLFYKRDTIWNARATCAYKFDNIFLIGTLNGLYRIDEKGNTTYLGKEQPLLSSRISAIEKSGDILWIATYGNGVIAYNNNKILAHITEQKGLTSNMCRNLAVTKDWLWVGTDKGLNKISLKDTTAKILNYTSNNGLNCDIINCIYAENDTVYVGTPYGLTFFSPDKVDNHSIAILNIDGIVSKNHTWERGERNLNLSAGDNRLSVDFSCVSFKSQGNITYYYKLSGADAIWHETKENILDFPSLPPGNYKLELYAVNAFGKRSNDVVIAFTIEKFFYRQLWFVLLVAGIILATGWFFILKRIRKIKRTEHEKLTTQKRLSELEQMAFRAQMNPHFIFNCLNSIQQYIFTKNVLDANLFITDFSSLIRQTMELSAKKLISLEEEIKYLSTYLKLEHTRFDENFDYNITAAPQLIPETIYLPPLLLQPFLENSIRHGIRNLEERKGKICVHFFEKNNMLFCVVEDNGIGRDASQKLKTLNKIEHQSKGVSLIEKRIEALNSENEQRFILNIEDLSPGEKYSGTKVTLQIPL